MQQVHALACDITSQCMHLTGICMHVLHALPHDITGRCMQLLHMLCCFNFVSDIPLSPATLPTVQSLVSSSHHSLLPAFVSVSSDDFCFLNQAFFIVGCGQRYQTFATLSTICRRYLRFGVISYTVGKRWHPCLTFLSQLDYWALTP